jgi:hypothetical protein
MTEHIEGLDQQQIDTIIDECRSNSNESFLFIPGIEMDCFFIYFLGIDYTPVDFTTNHTIFDSLRQRAKMCIFSHPVKAKYCYPQWLVDSCDGIEVLNTKHDGEHYLRPQSEKLYKQIKKLHPHIAALAGMDFHSRKNYTSVRLCLEKPGPLTEEFILDSLQHNQFSIIKNDIPLSTYGFVKRNIAKLRIHAMDLAHNIHKKIHDAGITVPSRLKSKIRRLMEGH